MEPFDLRDKPRYDLVVDRLAYWYYLPREWLKKVALMDDVYLLNSPFTFQSMEKHAAYCAMLRLGLKVPQTVLVPHKNPPDNARFAYTAAKYNQPFDLDEIAESIGYPLFMKPYDGGQWIGVSHISDSAELHRAYDESGQRLMHLQAAIDGFDVFARSLSIGAETMVMNFRPDQPMHDRYAVDHDFLTPEVGDEVLTISRLINAFFRWEFNSCETLVRGTEAHPIDYANASPDVARDEPALLLPVGDEGAAASGACSASSPAASRSSTSTPATTSRSATARTCPTRRSWPATGSWPTSTSRSTATATSATAGSRTSTSWCSTGSPRPTSTACSWTPSAPRIRRTSTSASSPTSAASSASGCASRRPRETMSPRRAGVGARRTLSPQNAG